jgi:hypothetical protein
MASLHDAKGRKTGLFIVDLWHGVLSHRQYVSSERHDLEYGGDESPVVNISFTVIDGSSYDMRGCADEPTMIICIQRPGSLSAFCG